MSRRRCKPRSGAIENTPCHCCTEGPQHNAASRLTRCRYYSPDTAARPFDPPLTRPGELQAKRLGERVAQLRLPPVLDAEWYHCWRCAPDDPRGERPAGELFHSAEELATSVCTRVSTTRQPLLAASTLGYTRAAPETWSALTDRMVRTLNALAVRHPGETVLCVSHGGPLEATVRALDPTVGHFHANYTCLAVFVETPTSATGWACLEKPDNSHVA